MSNKVLVQSACKPGASRPVVLSVCLVGLFVTPVLKARDFSVLPVQSFVVVNHAKPKHMAAPLISELPHTIWGQSASRHGLDPYILYAVALIESGRIDGDLAKPWAWAVNDHGHPHYHITKEAALFQIQRSLRTGRPSQDVGLMQINVRWHGKRVRDLETLIQPEVNIELGATILAEGIATTRGDLARGIGRYHAWSNQSQAVKYGHHVLELAERLRRLSRQGG